MVTAGIVSEAIQYFCRRPFMELVGVPLWVDRVAASRRGLALLFEETFALTLFVPEEGIASVNMGSMPLKLRKIFGNRILFKEVWSVYAKDLDWWKSRAEVSACDEDEADGILIFAACEKRAGACALCELIKLDMLYIREKVDEESGRSIFACYVPLE